MYIEKKGSTYRVKKQINGKRYTFIFDHKPTNDEILKTISKQSGYVNGSMTFEEAAISYIQARSNTLSPATLREYEGTLRRLSPAFTGIKLDDITQQHVQKEINSLAAKRNPKTIRNYHGFISSILAEFRPDFILRTSLPQRTSKSVYVPNSEDIRALLEYAKEVNPNMIVPILLGCASLRRGEICALTSDDIEGNVVHVTKDMVIDKDRQWVIKPPKTPESVRDIYIPDEVVDAINTYGLYQGHPNSISDWMTRAEKKLGLEHFSLHKCRHFFASEAHRQGICDADIMAAGGWKTDYVMKNIYRHSLSNSAAATAAIFNNLMGDT